MQLWLIINCQTRHDDSYGLGFVFTQGSLRLRVRNLGATSLDKQHLQN
jgi:hypothetical protein